MEKPTKKALSERISKVRKEVKTRAANAASGTTTPTTTPNKRGTPRGKKATPGTPASKKRTKNMTNPDSDDEEGGPDKRGRMPRISQRELDTVNAETSRTLFGNGATVGAAGGGILGGFDDIQDMKRRKRAASTKPVFKEEVLSGDEHTPPAFEDSEEEWKFGRDLIEHM
jgi:hypothetical protein